MHEGTNSMRKSFSIVFKNQSNLAFPLHMRDLYCACLHFYVLPLDHSIDNTIIIPIASQLLLSVSIIYSGNIYNKGH